MARRCGLLVISSMVSHFLAASATTSLRGGNGTARRLAAVNLQGGSFTASTTNFGFGSTTACGCTSPNSFVASLAEMGWYGAASTVWMGSPYQGSATSWSCGACSGGTCNTAISDNWGVSSFNNCAAGIGGCMSCWQLTVTDEKNLYGVQNVAAGTVVNVVVLDNCEMNNQYGNNQQWCVPFTNVPSSGCQISSTCQPTTCTTDGLVLTEESGSWGTDGSWNFGACGSATDFQCLNAAGKLAHFDLALDAVESSLRPWNTGDNPIVEATQTTCSSEVLSKFKATCDGLCSYE
jgi:hypothetical protein